VEKIMTEEKQRVAIAEACGWLLCHENKPYGWPKGCANGDRPAGVIPDYPADLNAMHEAEKVLSAQVVHDSNGERCPSRKEKYDWELHRICQGSATFATAAQRAEAFLRVIGRWKS